MEASAKPLSVPSESAMVVSAPPSPSRSAPPPVVRLARKTTAPALLVAAVPENTLNPSFLSAITVVVSPVPR